MGGGMIMVSEMFNSGLKSRIDGLCNELATLIANQPDRRQADVEFEAA
jgi:hypothetical protein